METAFSIAGGLQTADAKGTKPIHYPSPFLPIGLACLMGRQVSGTSGQGGATVGKQGHNSWNVNTVKAVAGQNQIPAEGQTRAVVPDTVAEPVSQQVLDPNSVHKPIGTLIKTDHKSQGRGPRMQQDDPPGTADRAQAIRRELQAKRRKLADLTTALRVVLKRREQDQLEFQDKVLYNVKQLIQPYLQQLKQSGISKDQRNMLNVVETNLDDLVSPFLSRLSNRYLNLTPAEIRVANFIRQGKSSREIAEVLNLSCRTVECHRDHIRGKLGLKHKKANLRTHLLSIGA
jgi:DNA-binding CsgD family transcriptional regulator